MGWKVQQLKIAAPSSKKIPEQDGRGKIFFEETSCNHDPRCRKRVLQVLVAPLAIVRASLLKDELREGLRLAKQTKSNPWPV